MVVVEDRPLGHDTTDRADPTLRVEEELLLFVVLDASEIATTDALTSAGSRFLVAPPVASIEAHCDGAAHRTRSSTCVAVDIAQRVARSLSWFAGIPSQPRSVVGSTEPTDKGLAVTTLH